MSILRETQDGPISCTRVCLLVTLGIGMVIWVISFFTGMPMPEGTVGLAGIIMGPLIAGMVGSKFANNKK